MPIPLWMLMGQTIAPAMNPAVIDSFINRAPINPSIPPGQTYRPGSQAPASQPKNLYNALEMLGVEGGIPKNVTADQLEDIFRKQGYKEDFIKEVVTGFGVPYQGKKNRMRPADTVTNTFDVDSKKSK